MLTLTFNSTKKTALLSKESGTILADYSDVPTVQVRDGYYEIMQKQITDETEARFPVCRLPISNTLMFLTK